MAISDADFEKWLKADYKTRCVLVEAIAYSGGVAVSRYFSNKAYISGPTQVPANQPYDDTLVSVPTFKAELSGGLMGASVPSWGDYVLTNEGGLRDSWLTDAWDGRAIGVYLGDVSWARSDFRSILAGTMADIYAPQRDQLALKVRDKAWMLNKAVQATLIGGISANKNMPKPIALGQCFNVEPVLDVAATHHYLVHDGAINDVTDVRDNGVSVAYTKDLANGGFTLNAAPAGRVTCDVQGAKPGGTYLTKCADLVNYVVTTYSSGMTNADIDAASFTAFNATCPQTLGRYIRGQENLLNVLDDLVSSVGGYWTFTRPGMMQLGRLDAPAGSPAMEWIADDVAIGQLAPIGRTLPVKTLRIGYQRNYTVQQDGLAGAVTEANRALFAAPYQVSTATNAGITTTNKLAQEPGVIDTCLVAQADGDAEAARRAGIFNVVRTAYRVGMYMAPYKLALGQVGKLTHPRFGFAGGALGVVIAFEEQITRNRATVTLWK